MTVNSTVKIFLVSGLMLSPRWPAVLPAHLHHRRRSRSLRRRRRRRRPPPPPKKVKLVLLPAEKFLLPNAAKALNEKLAKALVPGVDERTVAAISMETAQGQAECVQANDECYAKVAKLLGGDRLLWVEMERPGKGKKKGPVKILVLLFDAEKGTIIGRAEERPQERRSRRLARPTDRQGSLRRRADRAAAPATCAGTDSGPVAAPATCAGTDSGPVAAPATCAGTDSGPVAGTITAASVFTSADSRFASSTLTSFTCQMTPTKCPYCQAPLPAAKPGVIQSVILCQSCGRAIVTAGPAIGSPGAGKSASPAKTLMWTGGLVPGVPVKPGGPSAAVPSRPGTPATDKSISPGSAASPPGFGVARGDAKPAAYAAASAAAANKRRVETAQFAVAPTMVPPAPGSMDTPVRFPEKPVADASGPVPGAVDVDMSLESSVPPASGAGPRQHPLPLSQPGKQAPRPNLQVSRPLSEPTTEDNGEPRVVAGPTPSQNGLVPRLRWERQCG